MNIKKITASVSQINIPSFALCLIASLWFIKATYAVLVYVQFPVSDVIWSIIFVSIIFGLIALPLFNSLVFRRLKVDRLFWFFFFIGLALVSAYAFSPSHQFVKYAPSFPLLQAEMGLGWHQDTAFHVSLIHGILNNGWTSIGQHGLPITVYHVLSHYMDAFILGMTGLDPWDSYGFLYSIKELLLVSSLILLLAFASSGVGFWFFLGSLLFFIPVAINSWHAIGSHGLWFTSLLNILFMPMVFKILFDNSLLTIRSYVFIFVFGVLLALGKVSTGVGFVGLVLCFLWLKNPRSIKVYLLGLFWFIFFFVYRYLFVYGVALENSDLPSSINLHKRIGELATMIFEVSFLQNQIHLFLMIVALCLALYFFTKNVNILKFFASTLASAFLIVCFFVVTPLLSSSDVSYFIYGLNFQITLLFYLLIAQLWREGLFQGWALNWGVVFATLLCSATFLAPKTHFNFFNPDFKYVAGNFLFAPYVKIQGLDVEPAPSRIDKTNRFNMDFEEVNGRSLKALKLEIEKLQNGLKIKPGNSFLFIPKEVFENEVVSFKGADWARGMLITAVTGIPLVHGLKELRRSYGYADYDENALWRPRNELATGNACSFGKTIIVVEQLSPPQLSLHPCPQP